MSFGAYHPKNSHKDKLKKWYIISYNQLSWGCVCINLVNYLSRGVKESPKIKSWNSGWHNALKKNGTEKREEKCLAPRSFLHPSQTLKQISLISYKNTAAVHPRSTSLHRANNDLKVLNIPLLNTIQEVYSDCAIYSE